MSPAWISSRPGAAEAESGHLHSLLQRLEGEPATHPSQAYHTELVPLLGHRLLLDWTRQPISTALAGAPSSPWSRSGRQMN